MLENIQPIPTVFVGLVACLLAWSIARAINGLRAGQVQLLVIATAFIFFTGMMAFFFGAEPFLPPYMSAASWLVGVILFGVVFVINLMVLPLLQKRLGAMFVRYMSYAAALFFAGAFMGWMAWSTATTRPPRFGEMFVPAVLFGLGAVIGVVGWWKHLRDEI